MILLCYTCPGGHLSLITVTHVDGTPIQPDHPARVTYCRLSSNLAVWVCRVGPPTYLLTYLPTSTTGAYRSVGTYALVIPAATPASASVKHRFPGSGWDWTRGQDLGIYLSIYLSFFLSFFLSFYLPRSGKVYGTIGTDRRRRRRR